MRESVAEVFLFIYSTLTHWQALVSGGIITALIVVFERLSGYHLKKKTYLGLFVGVFLMAAFFLSWREERRARLSHETQINNLLAKRPRFKGDFEFFSLGTSPQTPAHVSVALVMSISNVGATPSIADSWKCYLNMQTPERTDVVKGEFRSFPEGLELPRGANQPLVFGREDALYFKTMRTPIMPGAKIVGAMLCIFPKAETKNLTSSENNTLVVRFRDILGEHHEVVLPYMKRRVMEHDWLNKGEWVDIPGMEQPPAAPTPTK